MPASCCLADSPPRSRNESMATRYAWLRYERWLEQKPIMTKCVTRGACFFVGDCTAQAITERRLRCQEHRVDSAFVSDKRRLAAYTAWGVGFAPVQHYWCDWLHDATAQKGRIRAAVLRTAANTLLFVPTVMYPVFFYTTGVLRGSSLAECREHLRCSFLRVYAADLAFWLPTEFAIFYGVPVRQDRKTHV
eukprot:TRINITY_DN88791_c0_g1_i1.p1 TRINITY_DN88791_c0_g1~~TRINITY_DN88791_c0_g1_i1.p1  ORF type:complete len:191 (-),score=25.01 TRINITY_DN88791_c0_g1_i1:10-582(-)